MSRKLLTRIISFLLVTVMVLSVAVSCAKNNDNPNESQTQASTEANPNDSVDESGSQGNVDAGGYELDSLPSDLKFTDTVQMLGWEDVEHPEFEVEDYDPTDSIQKALHDRLTHVEDRLGVKITFLYTNGDSGELKNWDTYIKADVEGGQEFYAYAGYSLAMAAEASRGYLYDLLSTRDGQTNYLDFSKPWWPERLLTEATVKNHLYFASGDISNNALYMMYTCFVNDNLRQEFQLPNPQDLVKTNEWTYEQFFNMAKDVYRDQNGDGEKNAAKEGTASDVFGYMTSGIHVDPWFYGTGALIAEHDANGNLVASPSFSGEKVQKTVEMLVNYLSTSQGCIYTDKVYHQRNFRDENLLFCIDRARIGFKDGLLEENENLKYSVVVCPKYDANGDYVTVMGNPFTLYGIPRYAAAKNRVSAATATLEALASDSYRNLSPAVFEIIYKLRIAQSPESAEMFDLIKQKLTFDLGRIFSDSLIGQTAFRNQIKNMSTNWSATAKIQANRLPNLLKTLQENLTGEKVD